MGNREIALVAKTILEALENQRSETTIGFSVPVGISARHVHLSEKDLEILFGKGHQLTRKAELMGGQFASHDQVTLIGEKSRTIEKVRVLGPLRKQSQVEISATDGLRLGIKAPVRESGDLIGSAPIKLLGPKGSVYLDEGCIIAWRHIHMSPADAKSAGVADGQFVSVKAEGERGLTFDNVKIRVDESFTLEMHLDTDEGNAGQIKSGDTVTIL